MGKSLTAPPIGKYNIKLKLAEDLYYILNPITGVVLKVDTEGLNFIMSKAKLSCTGEERRMLKQLVYKKINENLNPYFNSFEIILGWACNLSCKYCFENPIKSSKFYERFDHKLLKYALEFIDTHRRGSLNIGLNGGEPLLLSNIPLVTKIFRYCRDNDGTLNITTNGLTLKHVTGLLTKYQENIGHIRITIDGPEIVHNARRSTQGGGKSFGDIIVGIDRLLSEGFPESKIIIITKLDKDNIGYLQEYLTWLETKGWLGKIRVGLGVVGSYGTCYTKRNRLADEREELLQNIINYFTANPVYLRYVTFDDECMSVDIVREILLNKKMPTINPFGCNGLSGNGCVLTPDGKVYPCLFLAEHGLLHIGTFYPSSNVYIDSLKQILTSHNILRLEECQDCNLLPICGGTCAFRDLTKQELELLKSGKLSLNRCHSCMARGLIEEEIPKVFRKYIMYLESTHNNLNKTGGMQE